MKYLFLTLFFLVGCIDPTAEYKSTNKEAEETAYKRLKQETEFEERCRTVATHFKAQQAINNGADQTCLLLVKGKKYPEAFRGEQLVGAYHVIQLLNEKNEKGKSQNFGE